MKSKFLIFLSLVSLSGVLQSAAQTLIAPSPNWNRALPNGPDVRVKITEVYAKLVGRDAYFWAWPLVNMYKRRLVSAPLNHLTMMTDYLDPTERAIACPNQDVVYGLGLLALEISPVVVQVPDFGDRFWVYQIVDLRTDSFVQLGAMYGTKPGFYLLVGPNWYGEVPNGITKVFRCSTNTGLAGPRIFQDDMPEDKQAVQTPLKGVMMYPIADYDGKMKIKDWANIPHLPGTSGSDEETRYAQVLAVLEAINSSPELKAAFTAGAKESDELLVNPHFYQDLDEGGTRLNSAGKYTVTFSKDGTPPVYGFWPLSIYDQHHFFIANPINRFSVGTKNKDLKYNADGSLTIYVQTDEPNDANQRANWLPAPKGDFSLYVRAYWPKPAVTEGS